MFSIGGSVRIYYSTSSAAFSSFILRSFSTTRPAFARGLFIFLRVDRLQHGGNFTDMFPRAQIENVAIPMDHAALPFCLREEVPDDFVQAEAFIRNDQPHAFQPTVLQMYAPSEGHLDLRQTAWYVLPQTGIMGGRHGT